MEDWDNINVVLSITITPGSFPYKLSETDLQRGYQYLTHLQFLISSLKHAITGHGCFATGSLFEVYIEHLCRSLTPELMWNFFRILEKCLLIYEISIQRY